MKDNLLQLARMLTREAGNAQAQLAAPATRRLQKTRSDLLRHVQAVSKSGKHEE
jgi:hypothetical protein